MRLEHSMSESVRRATAFHEAGHVVAAWRVGLKPKTATIAPTTNAAGSAETYAVRGITLGVVSSVRARVRAENHITVLLVGPAAQQKHDPRSRWRESGGSDYRIARELASELNAELIGSDDEATQACLRWFEIVARRMIDKYWPHVEAVASALIESAPFPARSSRT
jgi:hypothetical protein